MNLGKNKCDYCGIKDICHYDDEQRNRCKLPLGYRPINILVLRQAESLRRDGRNYQAFIEQMSYRDIKAWNDMCLQCRGIEIEDDELFLDSD
jgi:hypothetical protein